MTALTRESHVRTFAAMRPGVGPVAAADAASPLFLRLRMLRLDTFGGVVLRKQGVPHAGEASQRRRLGLLAVVAAAGGRPVSREKLLGYLWPETDGERAKHALRQSIYAVQRALQVDGLFLGTTALQLNADLLSSDVADFDAAVARGDHARAVELYVGPFLDGFYLEGLPEFERWAETERDRLARAHAASLETLAAAATARRDWPGAVTWWRRLAATDPLSSRYTAGLMRALAAVGDRAAALRLAAVHAALVRQELDAVPDPAVLALEAQLRAGGLPVGPADADRAEPGGGVPAGPDAARPAPAAGSHELDPTVQRLHEERAAREFGARFAIERTVAAGASLTAYAARDRATGALVELGVIAPRIAALARHDTLGAILDRVQALDHPGIVPMLEHGWSGAGDVPFYVLAWSDGPTLRELLERDGPLPVEEVVRLGVEMADALAHAHARGVLHGDLRAKHVQLVNGHAALKAFGIASAITDSDRGRPASTLVRFGAPAYLSPEQLAGDRAATERADVYSLGCVIHELLVGTVPFAAASQMMLVSAKLTQPAPSVRQARESVPESLDDVLRRALARLPSDRWRSAAELRDALAGIHVMP